MRNLQEATEMICDLKGSVLALDALVTALLGAMTPDARHQVEVRLDGHAEVARNVLLHASISEHTIAAFERDVRRFAVLVAAH
jgi:hypothetical protein